MDETLIAKMMKNLDLSREEAIQLIADDKRVDKGEKLNELSAEQKKVVKKMTQADREKKPTVYKFDQKKERKANPAKESVIALIAQCLSQNGYEKVEIVNKQGEISYEIDGNSFSVKLTAHRKAKS